jgi:hypothetical protein
MKQSLLVVSEFGNLERVYTPLTVYNLKSPKWKYGQSFSIQTIILENDKIYFVIDGDRYEHGYFEIYLKPPPPWHI